MARRSKKTEEQMKLFDEGGLKDEGGTVDPVSGNDVPVGSTQKEVRDDIPAQLSEGEFVFPADVTRYIGLENLMELRNKAKQGLAQMDAMGQMGNSEEATMDDTAEMDVDIDAMIDEFDPNSPETMEFNVGGAVLPTQQQFSYGFMPPSQQGFQAPGYSVMPQQSQFVTSPARTAVGQPPVAPELRRYVGPNDEILMIPFYDGKPMQGYTVPAGYKFKAEEEAVAETPEVIAPKVEDQEDRSDDRVREEAEQERINKEKAFNTELGKYANYAPGVGKAYTDALKADPFMTGKFELPTTAIGKSLNTISTRTDMMEELGKEFGLDMNLYKNKTFGFLPGNKYDKGKFMADLEAATYERQFEGEVYSDKQRQDTKERFRDSYVETSGFSVTGENAREFDPFAADRDAQGVSKEAQKSFAAIQEAADRARKDREDRENASQGDGAKETGAAESAAGNDYSSDPTGYSGSFSKGGSVKDQTQRALKSSRKK
jgi:hypothetical protein